MAPADAAGGGDEAVESGGPPTRRGVDRSAAIGATAGQNLEVESGSRKRKAAVMSKDLTSLAGKGDHLKVAREDSQMISKEIEDLRAQLDKDVKELGYCDANHKLRGELALKVKEMQSLRNHSDYIQRKNDEMRMQKEEMQTKNDDLVKENEELQTKINSMRKQYGKLQAKNDSLMKHNEELQAMNDGLRKHNKELEAKNVSLVKKNEEVQTSNDSTTKHNQGLKAKNDSMTKHNQDLQAKNDSLMKQNEEVQAKNDGLTKQNEDLQAKNVGLVKQNEEVQTDNDSMRKQIGELEVKNDDLTKRNEQTKNSWKLRAKSYILMNRIKELEAKNDGLEDLIECLARKERESNYELQQGRKELIMGFEYKLNGRTSIFGIKRMGELDEKPFQDACKRKYGTDDYHTRAAELVAIWQEELKKPSWHPFKVIPVNGEHKEFLDDNDPKLKILLIEHGDDICNAVKNALMEMNEYNPSGRYVVPELWNFRKGQKATMEEVLKDLFGRLKTTARRRQG